MLTDPKEGEKERERGTIDKNNNAITDSKNAKEKHTKYACRWFFFLFFCE